MPVDTAPLLEEQPKADTQNVTFSVLPSGIGIAEAMENLATSHPNTFKFSGDWGHYMGVYFPACMRAITSVFMAKLEGEHSVKSRVKKLWAATRMKGQLVDVIQTIENIQALATKSKTIHEMIAVMKCTYLEQSNATPGLNPSISELHSAQATLELAHVFCLMAIYAIPPEREFPCGYFKYADETWARGAEKLLRKRAYDIQPMNYLDIMQSQSWAKFNYVPLENRPDYLLDKNWMATDSALLMVAEAYFYGRTTYNLCQVDEQLLFGFSNMLSRVLAFFKHELDTVYLLQAKLAASMVSLAAVVGPMLIHRFSSII